jgi:hypothetical protein
MILSAIHISLKDGGGIVQVCIDLRGGEGRWKWRQLSTKPYLPLRLERSECGKQQA